MSIYRNGLNQLRQNTDEILILSCISIPQYFCINCGRKNIKNVGKYIKNKSTCNEILNVDLSKCSEGTYI